MTDTIEYQLRRAAHASRTNWIHFLVSAIILLGSMTWYESSQAAALRREVAQLHRDNSALRKSLSNSDQERRKTLAAFEKEIEQFHAELVSVRAETDESLTAAETAALRHADALVSKLEKGRRQQEAQQRQLSMELNKVKQSTVETSTRLNGISSDVGTVQREVESVGSVAREASANLQQTRGDVGLLTGMIATTSDEIQMLRDMGDKEVYEFTLAKADGMLRVGDIQIALDKADAKHNRFSVQILAADQRVEKRDMNVNQPVQFYVPGKGSQPYELVVNQVDKSSVKGYLATPVMTIARNDAGDGN